MPNDIVTNLGIGDSVGASLEQYDLGSEAQNVVVSYDANGNIIEDITTPGTIVASTKTLSEVLKGNANNYYGTSSTTASTAEKVVTISASQNFELKTGVIIGVAFDNTNVAANPTINVNGTGAKSIFKGNSVQTSGDAGILGGYTSYFQYNGTYWMWISFGVSIGKHIILNQSASEMTQRDNLQFAGYLKTTDDSTNEKTVVSDAPIEVSYATWQTMTAEQKRGTKWLITGYPDAYSFVPLTIAEYEAITTPDPNTFYFCYEGV